MVEVTKAYLCEAFMEWVGMESIEGKPANIKVPSLHASKEHKTKFVNETIGTFVDEYILPEFDTEKVSRLQQEKRQNSETIREVCINPYSPDNGKHLISPYRITT